MDLSALTTYDTTTILAGIVAIGGVVAGVKWGKMAVNSVLGMIRRS